jgi:outer membrane murein-binding lipoprotein Lpp
MGLHPHPSCRLPAYLAFGIYAVGLCLMAAGVVVAIRISGRQRTHMDENRAAAQTVVERVGDVEMDVHYLREFVNDYKAAADAEAQANRDRIEAVESMTYPAPQEVAPELPEAPER